ncbi:MAG: haloacid dehalogenase-like hydrolase [Pseudomonadota bacterium]
MLVGLDFDNTIVSYDALFHKCALEAGEIEAGVEPTKVHVRDNLRAQGKEEYWIHLQGYVYGARMAEAEAFPGALDFMRWAGGEDGMDLAIVSHKTRHPFRGPKYDLHDAARTWVTHSLVDRSGPIIAEEKMFFELTKADKWHRIGAIGCDYFIDDLPEILTDQAFPRDTEPFLFDPANAHGVLDLPRVTSWADFKDQCQRLLSNNNQ